MGLLRIVSYQLYTPTTSRNSPMETLLVVQTHVGVTGYERHRRLDPLWQWFLTKTSSKAAVRRNSASFRV